MSYLLDVNARIALGWPEHQHHPSMLKWFNANASAGWATTVFTDAGFVRLVCQPSFAGRPIPVAEAAELLALTSQHRNHSLVAMDFDFKEVLRCCTGNLFGHRQITDGYLLTAAIRNNLKLVTFDAGIPHLLATDAERSKFIVHLK